MIRNLLLLLLLPVISFSASKAPERLGPPSVMLNSYVNDYNTKTLYYEGAPIISQNNNNELLNLVPIITRNTVSGEINMQIFFSFYQDAHRQIHTPRTINVASQKRNILFPIVDSKLETTLVANHSTAKIKTTGSLLIFPETAETVMNVVEDTRKTSPISGHIGTMLSNTQVQFIPRDYSLEDLQARYKRNNPKNLPTEYTIDTLLLHKEPPFDNVNQISLTFDNGQTMVLSPYYTSVLYNMIAFYTQLKSLQN